MRAKGKTQQPAPSVAEHIVDTNISQEMRQSFLEYSYSVIYSRALPDARDGFKPVQRRILYQMGQMGLRPDKGHVKSSRVVGDVMGRLHPHGDSAIYEAMVRLAQPFTMRLPLVDGHGNFGSLDDGPAASRYTEVRLAPPALDMIAHLDEDTVDMAPNYDNTVTEPTVLPAAIPNLLVNGSSGIAVGMATNMAPHNLAEIIDAARYLLFHPEARLEELMEYVPGPDLPTGGIIVGTDGIQQAYETGRGIFRTRARAHIENITARKKGIVFTELPYMVGPEKVIEKLKDAINAKKITGITNVHNLTDRHHGMRLVVEIKNGFNPQAILSALYKHTPLEDSFGINNVALVEGKPQTLGLKALLQVFLDHRFEVVRRRTHFRLNKAREDLHLVEGLLIAVLNIDEVIAVIRSSDDSAAARERLINIFDLTTAQADYILELRLRRLTKFSQIELENRKAELEEAIKSLEHLLSSEHALRECISGELEEVSHKYATARRTSIVEKMEEETDVPLETPDEPCLVFLSPSGKIVRSAHENIPPRAATRRKWDVVTTYIHTRTRASFGVLTNRGHIYRIDSLLVPALSGTGELNFDTGVKITDVVNFAKGEKPLTILPVEEESIYALATRSGKIKRVDVCGLASKNQWDVISLIDDDEVVFACPAKDDDFLVMISDDAQLLRFEADKVRIQGKSGQGIAGMRLNETAHVIHLASIARNDISAACVLTCASSRSTLLGVDTASAKVTPLDRFPAKGRATGGVRAQRFLKGEDYLSFAWVGYPEILACDKDGKPLSLPGIDERRDGSGQNIATVIFAAGSSSFATDADAQSNFESELHSPAENTLSDNSDALF